MCSTAKERRKSQSKAKKLYSASGLFGFGMNGTSFNSSLNSASFFCFFVFFLLSQIRLEKVGLSAELGDFEILLFSSTPPKTMPLASWWTYFHFAFVFFVKTYMFKCSTAKERRKGPLKKRKWPSYGSGIHLRLSAWRLPLLVLPHRA
jgi:hypothetical protein